MFRFIHKLNFNVALHIGQPVDNLHGVSQRNQTPKSDRLERPGSPSARLPVVLRTASAG